MTNYTAYTQSDYKAEVAWPKYKISGADNTANSTPQNISCESGSCTEQDDADWLSSGGARDYGLLKTATNKTVRFVKYHLPMRLNLLLKRKEKKNIFINLD